MDENSQPVEAGMEPEVTPQEPTTLEPQAPIDNQGQVNSEPELYELPDGRKVDAFTLSKEWKENFLPEFTRKSQELSKMKESTSETVTEDWQPQTYAEILEKASEIAISRIKSEQEREQQFRKQIDEAVSAEINEIKKEDANINESALYAHANKFGFTSLKSAYENMKEIKRIEQATEQRVLKTIQTRQAEPVSTGVPNLTPNDGSVDLNSIYNESPMEMLKRLTKS